MLLTENGGEVCPVEFLLPWRFFCIFRLGFCRLCFVILIHREKIENEDSLRTVECLRGRLLAERVASRNAKEEVEQMENKVLYFFLLPIIFSFFFFFVNILVVKLMLLLLLKKFSYFLYRFTVNLPNL